MWKLHRVFLVNKWDDSWQDIAGVLTLLTLTVKLCLSPIPTDSADKAILSDEKIFGIEKN